MRHAAAQDQVRPSALDGLKVFDVDGIPLPYDKKKLMVVPAALKGVHLKPTREVGLPRMPGSLDFPESTSSHSQSGGGEAGEGQDPLQGGKSACEAMETGMWRRKLTHTQRSPSRVMDFQSECNKIDC